MNETCRICQRRADHQSLILHERSFGTGEAFDYFQCRECGCLQIAQIPADLGRFYPPHYYSFHSATLPQTGLKSRLAAWRDRLEVTGHGAWAGPLRSRLPAIFEVQQLGLIPLRPGLSVLDVGCGTGRLLSSLWRAGFHRIMGVDPFLPADREVAPGLWVRKLPVEAVSEQFDLVMLHHVLEHVERGEEMLAACRQRLKPDGRVLVRIPVVNGGAWEKYREFWVGLEAPRHLHLHTKQSLEILAGRAGLRLVSWRGEQTSFHYVVSELYRRGLPLFDAAGRQTRTEDHFTPSEMQEFDRLAAEAFAAGRSDQIAALLAAA